MQGKTRIAFTKPAVDLTATENAEYDEGETDGHRGTDGVKEVDEAEGTPSTPVHQGTNTLPNNVS